MTNQLERSQDLFSLPSRYYRTYPVEHPLGYKEQTLQIPAGDVGFLVIDVYGQGYDDGEQPSQNDPPIRRTEMATNRTLVRDHITPSLQAARGAGVPVVHLTNYLSDALSARSALQDISLRVDDVDLLEAWRVPSSYLAYSTCVQPQEGEYLVRKQHYSGFFDTNLDSLLRTLQIKTLIAVGFDSRVCLGNTLTDAMYRDYRVIALRDAIATREEPETRKDGWANFLAVRFLETHVGYTTTSAAWIEACRLHAK